VASLWEERDPARTLQPLDRLVGRSRAAVLLALDDPASTTQLAAALGQSLGGLGDHLAVLRDSGRPARVRPAPPLPDVGGLDAHEVIAAPVTIRLRGETVGVAQTGPFQLVADRSGVGEVRFGHPARDALPERRIRLV
jgi:hypothetical protein